MSTDYKELDEIHRQIMQVLMAGWMTNDDVKSEGVQRLSELSGHVGVPAEDLRGSLTLLETLGYVSRMRANTSDPTLDYKNINEYPDQAGNPEPDEVDPAYYLSDNGRRMIAAELANNSDAGTSTT